MASKRKFVYAVAKDRKTLLAKFGCSASTLSAALAFKDRSLFQRKIRSYAINVLDCPYFER